MDPMQQFIWSVTSKVYLMIIGTVAVLSGFYLAVGWVKRRRRRAKK